MNTKQMSDKLNELKAGQKITFTSDCYAGKTFEILKVMNSPKNKFNRTIVIMLEVGLPETYYEMGRFGEAKGKMLEFSNIKSCTLYAQKAYMNYIISQQ